MSKKIVAAQLDTRVFDEAQRLIEAGHFSSLDELLEAALRTFVLKYGQTPSLAARTVQALMAELDALEREHFEEFVTGYAGVAQQELGDDEMVSLLEIFKAYGFRLAMSALHDAQDSRVPLTPRYLETILEKSAPPARDAHATARERVEENNPLLAEVANLYEQEIERREPLTEIIADEMKKYVEEFPDLERWRHGFKAAATHNKRFWQYVLKCVQNYGNEQSTSGQRGKGGNGISKSERHRQEKQQQHATYYKRWREKAKRSRDT